MANMKATLNINHNSVIELDILKGTLGQDVIDIRNLGKYGIFAFDPSFISTASCESKITFVDGEKGILLYRGFPVDQLATESNYLEVCYILLYGEKPKKHEYEKFKVTIAQHNFLREEIASLIRAFHPNSHPMSIMCSVVNALSAFYHDSIDVNNPFHREVATFHLLAKMPIIAAMCYKHSIGQSFVGPLNVLSYAGNFLNMMFSVPYNYEVHPVLERAMDRILILHADHEQNASTFTVRTVGSSGTNLFSCVASGIASLWGSAHGGANEAALKMLEGINSVKHIPEFLQRVKDRSNPFRLMGFGHRIYKNYDPRAIIMRETCLEVLKALDLKDNLLEVAMELERVALSDPYFVERKLYPNIDFYSGIILKAMGIPPSMFTVVFALARTVGWIANWNEMYNMDVKITRPRQLYTGFKKRDFKNIF